MVFYDLLASVVDFIHLLIIVLWLGGWFVSKDHHPTFKRFHSIFALVVLPVQMVFSFRCPLVILSTHLRALAHPDNTDIIGWYAQPFVVRMLHETFGFTVSDVCVTMVIVLGCMIAAWTLWSMNKKAIVSN